MREFNVKDFRDIQSAVDECIKNGGGYVVVNSGVHKTGPIHLGSNVELHLEDGAEVVFSSKFSDYLPVVFTRWEGMECYNYSPLIYAKDCENVSVTGNGTFIGSGEAWWHWKKLQQEAANELCWAEYNGISVDERIYGTEKAALRPSFIQFINCINSKITDVTFKDGPQWTIHPVYCEDMLIKDVTVLSDGPNTDGLNPDSCKNVLIDGCTFKTGDDCIAINAGMNEDGWRVNKPCENIEIKNCRMDGGHGAVVIGSAVSGGVKNIYAHDCEINNTMQGIRIKSMRGRGGYVENAVFENIKINNTTDQAIQINMFYEFSTVIPKTEAPTDCRDIKIKNVIGTSLKTGIQIKGLPEHKLKDIELSDIRLTAETAFECNNVESIKISNVEVKEI